jgi:oxalate decarboxylase/phosphoglucose isomerase-like protein (cupin superfamily)
MKRILIKDLAPGLVSGIEVQMPGAVVPFQENYFEWTGSSLVAKLQTNEVSGGVLRAWHHTPVFSEIETHGDAEMFYFVSGIALMLFMDVQDGQPAPETAQIVRIHPGTQIVISVGKGHFVPVAEGNEPVEIIVVAPKTSAPRMPLRVSIEGIL